MKSKVLIKVIHLLLIGFIGFNFAFPAPAHAVSAADWRAGRIIDDGVFMNQSAMNVAQIQSFLASKVPVCDTWGVKYVGSIKRSQYATARGNPTPFNCLKDYYEVPKLTPSPNIPANNYGLMPAPAGSKSAAQLIWDAAQAYNINPQVLLVTLQKEQGLVTDDWPLLSTDIMYAMGAHCPDGPNGANCDSNYAGFSIQMREAAALFRGYLDNMNQAWWPYKKPYQTNYILWNTTYTNCGGANVYLESQASAALYTYTPYQPNQAALNAGYGTGDSCSAYGNRNFWLYFNDWFGSTHLYQPIGAQLYFDQQAGGIYIVSSGVRYLFPNWDMLINYNVDKYPIPPVNTSFLNGFSNGGIVSNLVWDPSGVYLVNNGWRHHLSVDMCSAWGFPCFDSNIVRNISPTFLEGHLPKNIDVPPLMISGGAIYKMESGKKLPLLSSTTLTDLGYTSNQALGVNALDATQPLGPLIVTKPAIIKIPTSPKIYFYDGQEYHHIPNSQTLEAWGLGSADITVAPSSSYDVQEPPLGNDLTVWASDTNNKYIVDKGKKLLIPSDLTSLWPTAQYQTNTSYLLSRLPSLPLANIVNSGPQTYYLDSVTGTRRLLQSQEDKVEFGYTSSSVPLNVSDTLIQTIVEGGVGLANGSLILASDQSGISVISNNGRLIIPDNETFADYGYSYATVRLFSPAQLSSYPIVGNLSRKVKNPYGYYYFYRRKGVEINHAQAYDMGIQPSEYQSVATSVVAKARATPAVSRFLYDDSDGKIYYGSGQAIHYVTTTQAFKAYGGNYGTVVPGTRDFITSFLLGPPV